MDVPLFQSERHWDEDIPIELDTTTCPSSILDLALLMHDIRTGGRYCSGESQEATDGRQERKLHGEGEMRTEVWERTEGKNRMWGGDKMEYMHATNERYTKLDISFP